MSNFTTSVIRAYHAETTLLASRQIALDDFADLANERNTAVDTPTGCG